MPSTPLRFLRHLGRSREIATALLMYGFGDVVERLGLGRYLRWGKRILVRGDAEPVADRPRGVRIRLLLERLGPTFIKFGQVMSTRPDLIPADVVDELTRLQEQVPPFDSETALEIIEHELAGPADVVFKSFERESMAAGSLGQVHRALHRDGTRLAVKIRRPHVVRDVERDLSLMLELAALIERHIPEAEIFDPVGLVKHFARTIRREMNFQREGATIAEFDRLFRNDATLDVPRVYPELTTEAVLTMSFVDGYRIADCNGRSPAPFSGPEVAANGARIFMKQAFELGMFHGDPHPGNIRILPDGSICLLDYGMVGVIDAEKREKLIDLFLAIHHRDVPAAVDVVQALGTPFRPIDEALLRADVQDFVENYYGVPLDRLNVGGMLRDFVAILSVHGIRCPADLMLLVRAMVTLEGSGRELDPAFNLARHLAPFIERIVRERYNPRRIAGRLMSETRTFMKLAHDLPLDAGRVIEKLGKDDLRIQLEHRGLDRLITELDRSSNRLVIGLVMASLIVASGVILAASSADKLWVSIPVFALSSLLGIWLIYGIFRSGRL